eukprot:15459886-Alexandrium_andersonii.AAC.1
MNRVVSCGDRGVRGMRHGVHVWRVCERACTSRAHVPAHVHASAACWRLVLRATMPLSDPSVLDSLDTL